MRYYYCTPCGNVGDFGKERKRGIRCQVCSEHELLSELDLAEYTDRITEDPDIIPMFDVYEDKRIIRTGDRDSSVSREEVAEAIKKVRRKKK